MSRTSDVPESAQALHDTAGASEGRSARPLRVFLVATTAVTLFFVVCLALGFPTVQRLPWWFWKMEDQHCFLRAAGVAILVAVPMAGLVLLRPRTGRGLVLAAFVALGTGYAWQHGLALAEGRGSDGLRDRLLERGHREFALTATRGYPAGVVLREYEQLVRGRGQTFARSKPPGQLLFYMASTRVAEAVMPAVWHPRRPASLEPELWHLANFAVLVFPLLACSTLVPLVYLGAVFLPREQAHWPALLYVVAPPTALVTMHMDQVLYPLLATSMWALAVAAVRRGGRTSWLLWFAAGMLAWTGLFVSFSLLPAVPIGIGLAWQAARGDGIQRFLAGLAVAGAGFLGLALVVRFTTGYEMGVAYARALANHRLGKRWSDAMRLPAALSTLSEFGYWMGVPLLAAFVAEAVASLSGCLRRRPGTGIAAGLVLAVWVATALAGTTYAEVARLWIFFLPAIALFAARAIVRWTAGVPDFARCAGGSQTALAVVLAVQMLFTVALKNWQDF